MIEWLVFGLGCIYAIIIGYVARGLLSTKIAEAKLKLEKSNWYKEKAKREWMEQKKRRKDLSKIDSLDGLLEELGIDPSILQNPLVQKFIQKFLTKKERDDYKGIKLL